MRHWRKMTWAILAWSVIMLVWIVAAVADRPSKDCAPGDELCIGASDVGTGIGVGLVIVLWAVGFFVLSAIWFMSRRDRV